MLLSMTENQSVALGGFYFFGFIAVFLVGCWIFAKKVVLPFQQRYEQRVRLAMTENAIAQGIIDAELQDQAVENLHKKGWL